MDIERYIDAAERHGVDTGEPDHEIGDLQDLLRLAWSLLTPSQRSVFTAAEEAQAVLAAGDTITKED